ncbi:Zn-dependent exopeptidase [Tilletiaria anomala UBC 951]|uniref:Zn-dependent exopeptidase n=1 Tax=Tilletiaria anomala (strain ATCC 24038 / CBS 436.72 / UBC 951) TaxID=1037660 RepID=A0A066VPP7_TILAU|nr:Zn-dependent exopeptidase [Tilletiaria anomala UBC 951]KDN43426.1 Zn-dependent exopeptidase [Tilletiaria anomala UBC 951]
MTGSNSPFQNACESPDLQFAMDLSEGGRRTDTDRTERLGRQAISFDRDGFTKLRERLSAMDVRGEGIASSTTTQSLIHSISHNSTSVLSLAVDAENELIFSGSQGECIYVWDLHTYFPRARLEGHTSSVLALEFAPERSWLFSSSGDNTVRIWDTKSLKPIYVVYPADDNVGDIFALKWCEELETLFLGCQNTSIQWISFTGADPSRSAGVKEDTSTKQHPAFSAPLGESKGTPFDTPIHKPNKFFDGAPLSMRRTTLASNAGATPSRHQTELISHASILPTIPAESEPEAEAVQLSSRCIVASAHYGYIYALELVRLSPDKPLVLISGSGDEDIKLWQVESPSPDRPFGGLHHLATLHNSEAGVLALATWQSTLFAGLQGGHVDVWDLETLTVLRTLKAGSDDVLSLSALRASGLKGSSSVMFTACADGTVKRFDARFRCTAEWKAHDGVVLCSVIAMRPVSQQASSSHCLATEARLLTGGSESLLKIWNISSKNSLCSQVPTSAAHAILGTSFESLSGTPGTPTSGADFKVLSKEQSDAMLVRSLSDFVGFQSVSSEDTREQCRQCALWLKNCLTELGAEAKIIAGAPHRNPLVMATFRGRSSLQEAGLSGPAAAKQKKRKRCLFYGHYDCIGVDGRKWESDPWTMVGRDGYLYGRGVSDNKGPTLAVAYAASQLLSRRELENDLVMLIEGEEERGSVGFKEALMKAKEEIGPIDVVLLSNSYWLGEDNPCMTVGLRGVVRATVRISGRMSDVHSGVEGGAVREPMVDMINLLSQASTGDKVLIPQFYDAVRVVTPAEREFYASIAKMNQSRARNAEDLIARWRLPTFSVHGIEVSGPGNNTVIPNTVEAAVSIRIVPDQSLKKVTASLISHIESTFKQLHSSNELSVSIDHSADWWSGKQDSPFAMALAKAIEEEWNQSPVKICEGGSIPAVAILEKELNAPAVHLPMGQASDSAHLSDERMRLLNLQKGKAVLSTFFKSLPSL